MYPTNKITGVSVGRNAGDGHGDKYHVAVTYREDDETKLFVHAGIEHEHQALLIAGVALGARINQSCRQYDREVELLSVGRPLIHELCACYY